VEGGKSSLSRAGCKCQSWPIEQCWLTLLTPNVCGVVVVLT